jgi:chromosome segregation ATPase
MKLEQQQETLNLISETLANKDDEALNLTRANENLQRRDQDAEGTIENLRTQIQQLISENENLAAKVEQAERDLEDQVRVAGNLAARLRDASGRVKRERDEDVDESLGPRASSSVKRRGGAVITIKQEDVFDLTGDD